MSIRVERYKNNGPAQCYNCQNFGHSSFHCGYQPRCVKCAGPHTAKDCTKTKDQEPKCTNCQANHTANYKQCPAYLKEKMEKTNIRITQPTLNLTQTSIRQTNPQKTVPTTFANIVKNNSEKANSDLPAIIENLKNHLLKISSGNANTKDTLSIILTILPMLLNLIQNE